MLYSMLTGGFYSEEIHGPRFIKIQQTEVINNETEETAIVETTIKNPNTKIPEDAVEITNEEYSQLLQAQSDGEIITSNELGKPISTPIVLTFEEVKSQKLKELADYRYMIESGGININGVSIFTDPLSQAKLTGAWVRMQLDPNKPIRWKGKNEWVEVNKQEIEMTAMAVSNHVQSCFNIEYVHVQNIEGIVDVEELRNYDVTTGWPTNALGVINNG